MGGSEPFEPLKTSTTPTFSGPNVTVEADFVQPKLCIPGQLNQNRGHGAFITIVCYGLRTSVGSQRRFDDIAPVHLHTPKCAIGCRSRTGLIVRSGRSTSFGRSPRLVPRSGWVPRSG